MKNKTSTTQPTPPVGHDRPVATPGKPPASGYAEPKPTPSTVRDMPKPDVAGNEASQVTGGKEDSVSVPPEPSAALPGEEEEEPDDTEPTPPGEHKREPIKDPDPADTKLHVG